MFTWGISEHPSFQQEEGSFSIQTQSERYSSFSREQNWTVLLLRRMWREKTEWERAGRNCTTVAESNRFRQREREVVPEITRSHNVGKYHYLWIYSRLVKNLPAMQETWVWSLGWEDPLEKGKATHSSILAWRIPETA